LYQFFRIITCVALSHFFTSIVLAKESIEVVTENWYPYNYLDDNHKVVGQSTELVIQVLNAAEVDFTLALYPWTRALNLATTKANVLLYTVLRTPDREDLFHWVCPIAKKNVHQIYRLTERNDIELSSEQDIKNYSVVVTRDTFLHQYMLGLGLSDGHNLHLTADDDVNATLFLAGRVDLLPAFDSAIYRILAAEGLDSSYISPLMHIPAKHYPDYCMALSKSTPLALVEKIRQANKIITTH
jgi:polar amino acid transport system substrate-binding protein